MENINISEEGLKILRSMTETELKNYIINKTFGLHYTDIISLCKILKKKYGLNTDLCLNYCLTQI